MNELTLLEKNVLQKLLAGEDNVLLALREQLKLLTVAKREMTGVGFYTTFALPIGARPLSGKQSFKFGDVLAVAPELRFGSGFLLYVKEGVLSMLEGYTFDEPWPSQITRFELSYVKGPIRDMVSLRAILHGRPK